MKYVLLLTAMLLLSACDQTASSVDVICSIPFPSISEEGATGLPTADLLSLDLYFERVRAGCP